MNDNRLPELRVRFSAPKERDIDQALILMTKNFNLLSVKKRPRGSRIYCYVRALRRLPVANSKPEFSEGLQCSGDAVQ